MVEQISGTSTIAADNSGQMLKLGTSDLLQVADDARLAGYKVRKVTLVDSRFKPLDELSSAFYSNKIVTKLKEGEMGWVRQFLATDARGTFVTTIELQSPKKDVLTLERRGMLRVEDESRESFISVLKKRMLSLL